MNSVLAAIGLAVLLQAPAGNELPAFEPADVHQIQEEPEKHLGKPLRLTGRFESFGAGKLRLAGSQIDFHLAPEIKLHTNPQHLELHGRLTRQSGRLSFAVDRLEKLPPENERFAARRKRIRPQDYPELYDLSRWARARGQWYDDAELKKLAADAYREAFAWEEDELSRQGDVEGLLALADRGERLRIDPGEAARIRRRALVIAESKLAAGDPEARLRLSEQALRLLPGSREPAAIDAETAKAYEQSPDEAYAQASAAGRRSLDRLFYRKLVARALRDQAEAASVSYAELAAQARRLLPEDEALARGFERLDLERQARRVDSLSRPELVALRERFRVLGAEERAAELTGQWLEGRRAKLATNEVEDRVALAEDYARLLGNPAAAADLYREALAIARSPEAEAGLLRLGYVKRGETWQSREQMQAAREKQNDESVLKPGDSEQRVIDRFRKPDAVSRVAGGGWISEQWRYAGPPRLWVYLKRSPATGQAVVTRVVAP